ncbi:RusA family crossover junction endodeoxyribonuclease [Rhizobium sp. RU33A]|uniref:RusA family crossover junction endodeoxyribonuclease n=1 Tax=Rhizobium sp. RU33A TaxID=1907413 RepID=UPI0009703FB9|nr:RusA family crossover junction endodeoxyribonuclease [Rhizobium sp. RU33A]
MEDFLFPFDFFIAATPVSLQGRAGSVARWKAAVAQAAQARISERDLQTYLVSSPLAITIYYFPTAPMVGDIDNIIKPIMDALIGVAYIDDQMVEMVTVQKFEPEVGWEITSRSEQLVLALDRINASEAPTPVVYVHIADDLSWRRR